MKDSDKDSEVCSLPLPSRGAVGGVSPPGSSRRGRALGRGRLRRRPKPGVTPGWRSWVQLSPETRQTQEESSSQAMKLKGPKHSRRQTQGSLQHTFNVTHQPVSSRLVTEVLKTEISTLI